MKHRIILAILCSAVSLVAMGQSLTAESADIDCGAVSFRQPVTATFRLKNDGGSDVIINDIHVSCGCLAAESETLTVAPGQTTTLKLTYDARQMGHFYKEACVIACQNDSKLRAQNSKLYLTMRGVVVEEADVNVSDYPYTIGNMLVDRVELEFDDINKGDNQIQTIHIYNNGTDVLTPNMLHLPDYLTATSRPENLMPHKAATMSVTLNSENLRDYGLTQTSVYLAGKIGEKVSPQSEIGISAVLLPEFNEAELAQPKPKLEISSDSIMLKFNGKKKANAIISLTNSGEAALNISSLQMFTPGLRITLPKQTVNPGETVKMKVTGSYDELKQLRGRPRILMITNDPKRPKVVIRVLEQF